MTATRVVVTAPPPTADKLGRELRAAGTEVIHAPVVRIDDPESWDDLDGALERLHSDVYDWLVFTSGNAVRRVSHRLDAIGRRAGLARVRVAAVGTATADALHEHGVHVDVVPNESTGRALAGALGSGPGTVLLPRVAGAPRTLVDTLEAAGWSVDEVGAYRNLPAHGEPGGARVRSRDFDVVTFTSPSAVRRFVDEFGAPASLGLAPRSSPAKTVACIGPPTASAAGSLGMRVDVVPKDHSAAGLVAALAGMGMIPSRQPESGRVAR